MWCSLARILVFILSHWILDLNCNVENLAQTNKSECTGEYADTRSTQIIHIHTQSVTQHHQFNVFAFVPSFYSWLFFIRCGFAWIYEESRKGAITNIVAHCLTSNSIVTIHFFTLHMRFLFAFSIDTQCEKKRMSHSTQTHVLTDSWEANQFSTYIFWIVCQFISSCQIIWKFWCSVSNIRRCVGKRLFPASYKISAKWQTFRICREKKIVITSYSILHPCKSFKFRELPLIFPFISRWRHRSIHITIGSAFDWIFANNWHWCAIGGGLSYS